LMAREAAPARRKSLLSMSYDKNSMRVVRSA
jgi:hypothetical protein